MNTKQAVFLLLGLAISCVMSSAATAAAPQADTQSPASLLQQQGEKREYIAENGRSIVITALGNLVRFESPRGFEHVAGGLEDPINGYVLAYWDPRTGVLRVLHNVYRSQSSTIKPGLSDFVPLSFEGPASGTVFSRAKLVRASVTVGTRDGLFLIRTTYSWLQGTLRVDSVLTAVSRATKVVSVKFQNRLPMDANGAYGALEPKVDVLAVEQPQALGDAVLGPSFISQVALCCGRRCTPPFPECPPLLPDFGEQAVNTHFALVQVGRDGIAPDALIPSYLGFADAHDPCERMSAGPCQGSPLAPFEQDSLAASNRLVGLVHSSLNPPPRFEQDSVVTSGWILNKTLAKKKSLRFLTRMGIF
jgi:hypothetical protein